MEAHYIQEMGSNSRSLKILYIKVLWEVKNLSEDNSYYSSDCPQRKETFPKHKGPLLFREAYWTEQMDPELECLR